MRRAAAAAASGGNADDSYIYCDCVGDGARGFWLTSVLALFMLLL